jgi:hypothetical protein
VGGQWDAPSKKYDRPAERVRRRGNDFFGFPSSTVAPGKTVEVLWRIKEPLSIHNNENRSTTEITKCTKATKSTKDRFRFLPFRLRLSMCFFFPVNNNRC